jgi:hypothetical protein
MEWLNYIGAAGTLLLGLIGLFNPGGAKAIVGLEATTTSGKSEFRASFGGLWLALGAVPFVTMEPLAFAFVGLVWLGTAFGRVVSFALDKTVDRQNLFNVGFEIVFGVLCLVGAPWAALLAAI